MKTTTSEQSRSAEPLDLPVWAKVQVRERNRQRRLKWLNRCLTPVCIIVALFIWWRLTR